MTVLAQSIRSISLFTLVIILIYYSLFDNIFTFNYEIELHKQYRLNFLLLPLSILILLGIKTIYSAFSYKILLLIVIICAIISLVAFSQELSYSNEHFFAVAFFIICFAVLTLINFTDYLTIFIYLLIGAYLLELFTGMMQLFALFYFNQEQKPLPSGTVGNSGVFSMIIVSGLPLINYAFFSLKKENAHLSNPCFFNTLIEKYTVRPIYLKYALIALMLLTASILSVTRSRTAIVSYLVIALILVISEHKIIKVKALGRKKITLLLCILAVCLFILTQFKTQSLSGRLLIYKISFLHFWDNFFLGIGLGKFSFYFPQWQSEYFKENLNVNNSFFLNAGETYLAFNEYFQAFKEIGIVGIFLCFAVFWLAFTSKSITHRKLVKSCKIILLSILISATSSYPFHVNFLLFVVGFCVAVLFSLRESKFYIKPNLSRNSIAIILTIFCFCMSAFTINGISIGIFAERWKYIEKCDYCEELENASYYSNLYRVFSNDGKFLALFGRVGQINKWLKPKVAIQILEESGKRIISVPTIQELSRLYLITDKKRAEKNLIWLTNYVPNKFAFKYDLLSFYILSRDTINGTQVAEQIVSMPVKIPSERVTFIRNEAKSYLLEVK